MGPRAERSSGQDGSRPLRVLEAEVFPHFPSETKYNANLFNAFQSLWPGEFTLSVRLQDCEDNEVAYDLVFDGDGSRLIAIAKDGIGLAAGVDRLMKWETVLYHPDLAFHRRARRAIRSPSASEVIEPVDRHLQRGEITAHLPFATQRSGG